MAFITFSKSNSIDTIKQSEYANNPEIKEALSFLSGIPYEVIILFLAFWLIVDLILRKKPEIARWFVPFKFLLTLMIIGNYAI
jgi:cytosine/uracil/thiamine/allantoin permease